MSDVLEDEEKITNEEKQINKYFEDNLIYEPYVDEFSAEQTINGMENTDLTGIKEENRETMENDLYSQIESPLTQETPKSDYVEIQVFFNRNEPGISFRDCTSEIPSELKNGSSDDVFYTRVASIDETFWNDEKNNENESVIANDGNGGRRNVVTYMVSQEKMETIVETIQKAVDRHDPYVCLDVKTVLLTKKMPSIADDFNNRNSQYDSFRKEIEDIIENTTNKIEHESDDNDFDPKRILDELKEAAEKESFENEPLQETAAAGMYQYQLEADKPPVYPNYLGSENSFESNEKEKDNNDEIMSQMDPIDTTPVNNIDQDKNLNDYYDTTVNAIDSYGQGSSKNPFELSESEKIVNEEIMNQMNSMYANDSTPSMNLKDYYDSMNNEHDSYEPEGFNK